MTISYFLFKRRKIGKKYEFLCDEIKLILGLSGMFYNESLERESAQNEGENRLLADLLICIV